MAQPIITPEAVVLDLERAGVASRTIAYALDLLALGVTLLVVLLAGKGHEATLERAAETLPWDEAGEARRWL